jgi:hypothetical protein
MLLGWLATHHDTTSEVANDELHDCQGR